MAKKRRSARTKSKDKKTPPLPDLQTPPPPMQTDKSAVASAKPVSKAEKGDAPSNENIALNDGLSEVLISDSAWAALEQHKESMSELEAADDELVDEQVLAREFPDYEEPGWVTAAKKTKKQNRSAKLSSKSQDQLQQEEKTAIASSNPMSADRPEQSEEGSHLGGEDEGSREAASFFEPAASTESADNVKSMEAGSVEANIYIPEKEQIAARLMTSESQPDYSNLSSHTFLNKQTSASNGSFLTQVILCFVYVGIGFFAAKFYQRYEGAPQFVAARQATEQPTKISLSAKVDRLEADKAPSPQPDRKKQVWGFASPLPPASAKMRKDGLVLISNSAFEIHRVMASSLNVRMGPDKSFQVVSKLEKGALVKARRSTKQGWLELEGGVFVSADYVHKLKED